MINAIWHLKELRTQIPIPYQAAIEVLNAMWHLRSLQYPEEIGLNPAMPNAIWHPRSLQYILMSYRLVSICA